MHKRMRTIHPISYVKCALSLEKIGGHSAEDTKNAAVNTELLRLDKSRLCSGFGRAQAGFDFAPHFLDGIEVRGVGRQEEYPGTSLRY